MVWKSSPHTIQLSVHVLVHRPPRSGCMTRRRYSKIRGVVLVVLVSDLDSTNKQMSNLIRHAVHLGSSHGQHSYCGHRYGATKPARGL